MWPLIMESSHLQYNWEQWSWVVATDNRIQPFGMGLRAVEQGCGNGIWGTILVGNGLKQNLD